MRINVDGSALRDPRVKFLAIATGLDRFGVLGRRIREVRHVAKICTRCNVRRHRARGLCHKCYKAALKRGEIKAGRQDQAKATPALLPNGFKNGFQYGSIGGRKRAKAEMRGRH